jgi:hypothetical protein
MPATVERLRILAFHHADSLAAARLRGISPEVHGPRQDVELDYDELRLTAPPTLSLPQGQVREHMQGHYLPRRLRFMGVSGVECSGLYACLDDVPLDHGARSLRGVVYWRTPGQPAKWAVFNGSPEPAELMLSFRRCRQEERPGPVEAVDLVRDWAPAPPMPARLFALHKRLHAQYGGDPVTVWLGGKPEPRRLFVGGQHHQGEQRPEVDAVLNLGDEPSRWAAGADLPAYDRWARKGEGQSGMDVAEIEAEAHWVIERLRAGQRVLVHCSAGFNRSTTICCAALMLLEQLSAEAALERVRQQHPWAKPDPHHWLALRWLAQAAWA